MCRAIPWGLLFVPSSPGTEGKCAVPLCSHVHSAQSCIQEDTHLCAHISLELTVWHESDGWSRGKTSFPSAFCHQPMSKWPMTILPCLRCTDSLSEHLNCCSCFRVQDAAMALLDSGEVHTADDAAHQQQKTSAALAAASASDAHRDTRRVCCLWFHHISECEQRHA